MSDDSDLLRRQAVCALPPSTYVPSVAKPLSIVGAAGSGRLVTDCSVQRELLQPACSCSRCTARCASNVASMAAERVALSPVLICFDQARAFCCCCDGLTVPLLPVARCHTCQCCALALETRWTLRLRCVQSRLVLSVLPAVSLSWWRSAHRRALPHPTSSAPRPSR